MDTHPAHGIELLVLSFLQQLVHTSGLQFPQKTTASHRRAQSKIQLQLANRTARTSTKTLVYPKKSNTASLRPFGESIHAELNTFNVVSTTLSCHGPCPRSDNRRHSHDEKVREIQT